MGWVASMADVIGEDGKIVGFAAVGIEEDDSTRAYVGTSRPVSRLRVIGAMAHFQYLFDRGWDGQL